MTTRKFPLLNLCSNSIRMTLVNLIAFDLTCVKCFQRDPENASWNLRFFSFIFQRYVECTSACIQALAAFQKKYPHHRTQEIASSILRARKYIESIQKDDGSW